MHRPDPPDRTVDGLATHVFEEIEARLGPDDACLILGFSGGGPTAYEAAQRMHATGRPVHLVLLDSAPTTKGRERARRAVPAEELDPGCRPPFETPPSRSFPVRCCGRCDTGGGCASSSDWSAIPDHRASSTSDTARSSASSAPRSRDYDPEPAAFPATLVQVDGSDALRRCGQLIPDLVVRDVGGEHVTMLAPPHVEGLAAIVAAAAQDVLRIERRGTAPSEDVAGGGALR